MKTYTAKAIGTVVSGLEVTGILRSENGLPVYATTCQECGARGVPVKHEQFNTGAAKCISSMHGRNRYQPTTIKKVRAEEAEEQRRSEEDQQRPLREAEAQLTENHRKLFDLEKAEVIAGKKDMGWSIPASMAGKSMSLDEAKAFSSREAEAFVAEHPEFYKSKRNRDAVLDYLLTQGVMIADRHCYSQAVERLRHFGLLEEPPAVEPQAAPVVEQPTEPEPVNDGLTDGWDIQTGQPRKYTEREIEHMSSDDFKKAFRMWVTRDGDRRPKFSRSRYQ
ncbi:MAG TPA: hypothetical protein VJW20_07305 [Candidatus Angelobacter sp.]|nr:hypothetical protein [Candidatus Angelobacter sp.]